MTQSALPEITVKRASITEGHPWIRSTALVDAPKLPPGCVVDLVDEKREWMGRGFYNRRARVAVRLLTTDRNESIDEAFFHRRVSSALQRRVRELRLDSVTSAYRVIHGEGDGLSGLVLDRYGFQLAVQYFAAGMFRFRPVLDRVLADLLPGNAIYPFAETHTQKQESFDLYPRALPTPVEIQENGVKYTVQVGSHHKTGFFCDQRENRDRFASEAAGKTVLDLCCHTGGFALSALARGRAKSAVGVDLDPAVVLLARANAALNGVSGEWIEADILDWLDSARGAKKTFDMVVLDPPKQVRDARWVRLALRNYERLNAAALQMVEEGGRFVSCSCSGLVGEKEWLEVLQRAAERTKRRLEIDSVTGAAADHPVRDEFPEGRYLKVAWGRVYRR